MKKKGISQAVLGFTTIAAVVAGYLLGKKVKNNDENVEKKNLLKSRMGKDQLIEFQEAQGYHCKFIDRLDHLKKQRDVKQYEDFVELFRHPIDIDNAKKDFKKIFKQRKIAGMRMYPGLKDEIFTPIFIGTKSDLSDLIEITAEGKQTALVQDNNRPCNPCHMATFNKNLPCKEPARQS